jgi:hypothetical protein
MMVPLVPIYNVLTRTYSYMTIGEFRALLGATSVPAYVGGPTGAIVVDNTKTPPEIDIATEVVPRKAQSETITGHWTFEQP